MRLIFMLSSPRLAPQSPHLERGDDNMKIKRIGHVDLRVVDEQRSRHFYRDILGFDVSEEDPEHGGVFMTLGDNFHTIDVFGHPDAANAPQPNSNQVGLFHIAFEVGSYSALKDAYS